jgi:lipid-A-disaccharide synthase
MKVAVVAGEASGDRQAASLLAELNHQLGPDQAITSWGIGGSELRKSGCNIVMDSSNWGTIGIVESSRQLFSLLFAMAKFKRLFLQRRPELLLLVDFGAFNIPLAAWAKKTAPGCVVCYYFPPSSWRRKMSIKKLQKLSKVSDIIFTPFPWSCELLKLSGGNSHFVGHPLLDTVKSTLIGDEFDKQYGLDANKNIVALLPGSRKHEIHHILPVMLGAASEIARRTPGVQFLIARADNIPRQLIEDVLKQTLEQDRSADFLHFAQQAGELLKSATSVLKPSNRDRVPLLATPEGLVIKSDESDYAKPWTEHKVSSRDQSAPVAIVDRETINTIARADLVIAASGTVTLEAAILGTPQIIVYRGSTFMNIEYKLRQKALNITYIGLPNILAGEQICPEFVQEDATVKNVSEMALDYLLQPEKLLEMRSTLRTVIATHLGEPGATARTATTLLEFIGENRRSNAGSSQQGLRT